MRVGSERKWWLIMVDYLIISCSSHESRVSRVYLKWLAGAECCLTVLSDSDSRCPLPGEKMLALLVSAVQHQQRDSRSQGYFSGFGFQLGWRDCTEICCTLARPRHPNHNWKPKPLAAWSIIPYHTYHTINLALLPSSIPQPNNKPLLAS